MKKDKNEKPVILACGLSGSGKTYNTLYLEKRLKDYVRLNPEIVRDELGITCYSRKDTPKILARIIDDVEKFCNAGKGVIVDANLKSTDLRQCFYDLAKYLNKEIIVIEFVCSDLECKKRIVGRVSLKLKTDHPSNHKVYEMQKKSWQDICIDMGIEGNNHVSLIRYDSSINKMDIIKANKNIGDFIKNIRLLLENEREKN